MAVHGRVPFPITRIVVGRTRRMALFKRDEATGSFVKTISLNAYIFSIT